MTQEARDTLSSWWKSWLVFALVLLLTGNPAHIVVGLSGFVSMWIGIIYGHVIAPLVRGFKQGYGKENEK